MTLVRPGKHQCDYCETPPDYFAVYSQKAPKAHPLFLCHVQARGKKDALRIARAHGLTIPRWSYAVRIGKQGYYAALAKAFNRHNV